MRGLSFTETRRHPLHKVEWGWRRVGVEDIIGRGLPRGRGLSFDETGATPSIEWKWGWRRVEAKEIMNPMVPRGVAAADFITHPRSARWQPPYLTHVWV